MKQSKMLLALSILFSINCKIYAQECIVVPDALKGRYEGGCDKGKAHGQGKAFGYDSYEGEFKNGYPDGKGMYIWKDQHYFIGHYKKGIKEGRGDMYYESATGQDSIISGYWKKDVHAGEYEKPYEVRAMTSRVSKVNCRISDKQGHDININITKIGGGIVAISDIVVLNGTFYKQHSQSMTHMSVTRVQQVTFPFRAIFTFATGETTEILFNEKGDYDVDVEVM